MAKKKYVKPMMVSEEFTTENYCSTCGPTNSDLGTLYAKCAEGDVVIKIAALDPYGNPSAGQTNGYSGAQGGLFKIDNNGNYVFAGPIDDSNHPDGLVNGEYAAAGTGHGDVVGQTSPTTKVTVCAHPSSLVSGQHHHLTNGRIVYVNHS